MNQEPTNVRHSTSFLPSPVEVEQMDFSCVTLSVSLIRALGAFFCEIHGLVPFHNGKIGVNGALHPDVAARVLEILGDEVQFASDSPEEFFRLWMNFVQLHFSQDDLLDHLVESGELDENAALRLRNMSRAAFTPVDRLLVELELAAPERVHQALCDIGGVRPVRESWIDDDPDVPEMMPSETFTRMGVTLHRVTEHGIDFHLTGLLLETDAREILQRCDGAPFKFELLPP
jgi:hypothetical protein